MLLRNNAFCLSFVNFIFNSLSTQCSNTNAIHSWFILNPLVWLVNISLPTDIVVEERKGICFSVEKVNMSLELRLCYRKAVVSSASRV